MSVAIRRRTVSPIDKSNQLAKGLKFYSVLTSLCPWNIASPLSEPSVSQNGPQFGYGPYGPCLTFNRGSNSSLNFGVSPAVGSNSDLSVNCLMYFTGIPSSSSCGFVSTFWNAGGSFNGWSLNYSNFPGTVGLRLIFGNGGIAGLSNVTGGTTILNRWCVVGGTFRKSTGDVALYIDGQKVYSVSYGSGWNTTSPIPLCVGAESYGGNGMNGSIAWASVHERVLGDAEMYKMGTGDVPDLFVKTTKKLFVLTPPTSNIFNRDLTDTLSPTEVFKWARLETFDTLTFTEHGDKRFPKYYTDDALALLEQLDENRKLPDADGESITFTEGASAVIAKSRALSDTLTFTHTQDFTQDTIHPVEDTLAFTETNVRDVNRNNFGSDALILTETATGLKAFNRSLFEVVAFTEENKRNFGYAPVSSMDSLVLTEHYFGVYVDAQRTEAIAFTETGTWDRKQNELVSEALTLSETCSVQKIASLGVSDLLVFRDPLVKYYGDIPVSIDGAMFTIVRYDYDCESPNGKLCILKGMSRQIALPSPVFGDGEQNGDVLNVFRTATGRLVPSVKRNVVKTLTMDFQIPRPKALELRDFVDAEISNQITFHNWKGEIWVGFLFNNPILFETTGRIGPCYEMVKTSLELKAVRIH